MGKFEERSNHFTAIPCQPRGTRSLKTLRLAKRRPYVWVGDQKSYDWET